jgi:hypothetical protein
MLAWFQVPFSMYQGTSHSFNVDVFQTIGTQNQCACAQGPTVSIPNVNLYPSGSNAYIYWGGPGNGPSAQATNNITTGPITLGTSVGVNVLNNFVGQQLVSGAFQSHYNSNGSYNLVYMVEYGGSIFSKYYRSRFFWTEYLFTRNERTKI